MWGMLGVAMSVAAFGLGCLVNIHVTAFLAAALLPLTITAGFAVRKQLRMRDSVLMISGAALAGAVAAIGVLWLLTGLGPIDYIVSRFGAYLNTASDSLVSLIHQYVRLFDIITGAVSWPAVLSTPTPEAVSIILDRLRLTLNYYLVSGMISYALLAGLLGFVITRAFVKKRRGVVSVPSFGALELPSKFWLAYFISYLFAYAGTTFGWPSFDILTETIIGVYGVVFIVQALSLFDYLYKRRHMSAGVRVLLHVVITLFFGSLLAWVGLFENIAKLRRRMDTEGGMKP